MTDEFAGIDLGDQRLNARADEGFGLSKSQKSTPFETKEIARWLHGYPKVSPPLGFLESARVVE